MVEVNIRMFVCNICDLRIPEDDWIAHTESNEHIKKNKLNNLAHLYCEKCDVYSRSRPEFARHLATNKHHKEEINMTELFCKKCDLQCRTKYQYDIHLTTTKHKKEKAKENYSCEKCNFICKFKSVWENHILQKKHIKNVNGIETPKKFTCEKCDYTANLKHHYEQHCATKKHIEQS